MPNFGKGLANGLFVNQIRYVNRPSAKRTLGTTWTYNIQALAWEYDILYNAPDKKR